MQQKNVCNAVEFVRIEVSTWSLKPRGISDQMCLSQGPGWISCPECGHVALGKARSGDLPEFAELGIQGTEMELILYFSLISNIKGCFYNN